MPLREPTDFSQQFCRQLEQIRAKIESLPEQWRPYFRALANQAEERHRDMERNYIRVCDLVDDMRLNEASVKFDLWAAAQNLRTAFAAETGRRAPGSRPRPSLRGLPPAANTEPDARR